MLDDNVFQAVSSCLKDALNKFKSSRAQSRSIAPYDECRNTR